MNAEKELRIAKLTIENFKRIEVVEIEPCPGGGLVVVAGKNAQGKSSILDAIMAALCGGREIPEMALREGTDEGFIRVDLGEYVVERTFKLGRDGKPTSSKLKVTTAEGAKFDKPQQLLDAVIGRIGFDPLAFTRMGATAQVKELIAVSDIELDPEAWAKKRQGLYDARTVTNRDIKKLEGAVEKMPHHTLPAVISSVAETSAELKAAHEKNAARQKLREEYDGYVAEHVAALAKITELEAAAAAIQGKLEPEVEVAPLEEAVEAAAVAQNKVAENKARDETQRDLDTARALAKANTADMEKLDGARAQALAQAELPVDGLAFDAEGVTLNGIPFGDCALSEKLTVSTAIAMAANPTLRVALIRDGSLLDSEGREALGKLAKAEGYQVWFECVEGRGGFEIREGRVVGAEEVTDGD